MITLEYLQKCLSQNSKVKLACCRQWVSEASFLDIIFQTLQMLHSLMFSNATKQYLAYFFPFFEFIGVTFVNRIM